MTLSPWWGWGVEEEVRVEVASHSPASQVRWGSKRRAPVILFTCSGDLKAGAVLTLALRMGHSLL